MINLTQEELIRELELTFPKETYRALSKKCGIQQTRFFRILNGHEMKLSEYLRIQEVIKASPSNSNSSKKLNFLFLAERCAQGLPHNALEFMSFNMQESLKTHASTA